MDSSSITKFKKRKTRKCLNEIRKRSRRSAKLIGVSKCTNSPFAFPKQSNCLTSERLTIAMFPKVVCSETATRHHNASFRKTTDDPKDILKPISLSRNISNILKTPIKTINESSSESSGHLRIYNEPDLVNMEKPIHDEYLSSESNFMCQDKNTQHYFLKTSHNKEEPTIAPYTSHNSRHKYAYSHYDEFINQIPSYLKQIAPELTKCTVIKDIKGLLRKYRMNDNYQYESEPNLVLRQSAMKNNVKVNSFKEESEAESDGSPSIRVQSLSTPPSTSAHSLISDTPCYHYYPHRLNQ